MGWKWGGGEGCPGHETRFLASHFLLFFCGFHFLTPGSPQLGPIPAGAPPGKGGWSLVFITQQELFRDPDSLWVGGGGLMNPLLIISVS